MPPLKILHYIKIYQSQLRRGKITLVAFVWLYSTVHFQMLSQIACPRRSIVTLVAFVWFFSTVYFQMFLQSTFITGCIITLVAFVRFFSTVRFQVCTHMARKNRCIITLVAFVRFFPVFTDNSFTKILLHGIIMFKALFHRQQVCPLLLLVLNWESSNVKLPRKRKWKWK